MTRSVTRSLELIETIEFYVTYDHVLVHARGVGARLRFIAFCDAADLELLLRRSARHVLVLVERERDLQREHEEGRRGTCARR